MVSRSDFLDVQNSIVNGTIGLSLALTGWGIPVTGTTSSILGVLIGYKSPIDLKQSVLNRIDSAAGYTGKWSVNK